MFGHEQNNFKPNYPPSLFVAALLLAAFPAFLLSAFLLSAFGADAMSVC